MFSKATLIGVVGIEPKYKAAANGKDSIIYFRLGCEVFTNSKKITEWYIIKAFGRVADYLYQTIQKGSFVFLEASIRNKRWMTQDIEHHGIEFHAFTARVVSNADIKHNTHNDAVQAPDASLELPFPEMEKVEAIPVAQPKLSLKPLTAEEAYRAANRLRLMFEAQRQRIANLAANVPTKDIESEPEKIPAVPGFIGEQSSPVNSYPSTPVKDLSPSGNTMTDKLLNAKNSLNSSGGRTLNFGGRYAQIRGNCSNKQ
ncbi:single-stranded DNA-binding protein [Xenorhabdus sp. KJ12.1]|uniref:single-stranded DNA-binding protein n=1 Tax=Xenorhabdus sp. KJ12.1 TaxID=1851571 RepID=UPI000C05103C|nr:single-stranded DNA-binding protein [Xenorhabdus sp. KJ12.1]PHM72203.1 single-stranded DNA-binding protein [Xenorhabdus sp. KJ12.1]